MTNQTNGKDPLIHFPFYLNQYQGILSRYSLQEKGAFISLLCVFLLEDENLPENFDQLCRMCLAFSEDEKSAIREVKNHVVEIGKEILKNQRIKRQKCRQAASLGGSARVANAQANATQTLKHSSSNTENRNRNREQRTETEIEKKTEKRVRVEKEFSSEIRELSDGLKFVLEAKLNKKLNTNSWKEEIRKLLEIDLKERENAVGDVKRVIQEVSNRFGEQYFPVIQSAASLREKFSKVETSIKRNLSQQPSSSQDIYNNLKEKYKND